MLKIEPITSKVVLEQVVFIAHEIWVDHYLPIIGQAQVDYMLDKFQSSDAIVEDQRAGYEYFSIESDDKLVGYFSYVNEREHQSVFLSKIYIHNSVRGTGVGAKAMGYILARCREYGAKVLSLTVNKKNEKSIVWYRKQGFSIVEAVVADIGGGFFMDDYKMAKMLSVES